MAKKQEVKESFWSKFSKEMVTLIGAGAIVLVLFLVGWNMVEFTKPIATEGGNQFFTFIFNFINENPEISFFLFGVMAVKGYDAIFGNFRRGFL